MVRSAFNSTAISELNGNPVLLTPSRCRASSYPIASQTNAKTKGLDTLWIENATSASPISKTRPLAPATQIPNSSGDALASSRDVVGDGAVAVRPIALVRLGHHSPDAVELG